MTLSPLHIVILAAGQGKRMHSRLPKVLQPLAGRPLLDHVIQTAKALEPASLCVVHGHGGNAVFDLFSGEPIVWAKQREQRGTAHALMQAFPLLPPHGHVMVLYGDVPCVTVRTLNRLWDSARAGHMALLTVHLQNPQGYGRILRHEAGAVRGIIEEKDASPAQKTINEVNTGMMVAPYEALARWLPRIGCENAQNEYYLTDVVSLAVAEGMPVHTVQPDYPEEVLGVNDRIQLATLERHVQAMQATALLNAGVSLADPGRLEVRGTLRAGRDVWIDVGCVFEGDVMLEDGVHIGPHCCIRNSHIGPDTHVDAFSVLDGAMVGPNCHIGPYARLRPGTRLDEGVKIGNFVEIKKSHLQRDSKASHLSYLGDAQIGERVNIGAGTITCNYDGINKHETVIEDDAFIGSDTQLVAPVRVGRGAVIGAGTTLTRDAACEALTVARTPQKTVKNWKRAKPISPASPSELPPV
jgi:bifunctional UDP-N-acetylglucosamine pyrophosphorylase / glucosamine-1-phosphate N-acetyltransferase